MSASPRPIAEPPPPLRVGVLTVSDACSRGEREDLSGKTLETWCQEEGHALALRHTVPDQTEVIAPLLLRWADGGEVDVILTTGGTGFSPRDVTPEATCPVLEKEAPGLAAAIREAGGKKTPYAPLSRGLAGTRGSVFLANLPGSPGGVRDALEVIGPLLRHVVGLLKEAQTPHRPS